MKRLSLLSVALLASPAFAATPPSWPSTFTSAGTNWTTTIDAATYGVTGSIVFNDWGYKGPTGVGANDFKVGSGFDSSKVGQVQTVVTKDPDLLTPDPQKRVLGDFSDSPVYARANMDGQVNFYRWAYTTKAGSTFKDMTIDTAGNYFVDRNNMSFRYFDAFDYHDNGGINPDTTRDTMLNFNARAISDARGWCGSVLTSRPDALERMAGQVTFDIAFDVYRDGSFLNPSGPDMMMASQIIPDFVMRSYGSYTLTVDNGTEIFNFNGNAVENNTNPLTGELDPLWKNQVSFLGAGVVPRGAWVFGDNTPGITVADIQGAAGSVEGEVRASDGATWHQNTFAGYAFMMRADGTRTLTQVAENWSNYASPAPEPEAVWTFAVGLGMVGGMAWRRKKIK